ncbi:phage baseplate assembly protein V [uncultured Chryseobacterium sp.]|uniref:type VI secretion system Vgr family protein n=1 Tax=uncultured Chryseobacterium sp. TaxID=259322 RepID=UPI0025CED8E2|nr:phage baseplate assembly protein V [uncultured Chryseobacterium sp.]
MKKSKTNADRIAENHFAGIQRIVNLEIIIEGKVIRNFRHFRLQQSIRRHHHFELTLDHDTLGSDQDHNLENAQQFLGKRLTVVFKYKDVEHDGPERTFVGCITQVAFSQEKASLGSIILKGKSPTILMDAAPHTQSFGGKQPVNTSTIADRIMKETLGSGKYDYKIDTKNKSYINYSAQYRETYYNYLARLAETYGEQFYYDGEVLHFGQLPPGEQPIKLVYGSNVTDISVELNAVHTKPEFFGYNSSKHEKSLSTTASIKHLGQLAAKAYDLNNNIYSARSLTPSPVNANMSLNVDDAQKSAAGSASVEVFTVSANTTVPFLYPGCIADIAMRKPNTNQTSYFTKVMITEVDHEVNTRGYYTGSFKAIAEGTGYIPAPEFEHPSAEPQIATVISNTDPLNQGRIQVQFDWQLNDTTHFIRMMSPDAGGTDAVTQNRGFVAVPEVGDQVMVGFEYHHPDFPFAMGGMFHGQVALGGGVNNHIKSIQTRSGNKIIFNDEQGSIYIEDPSGNTYFMDGKGNISVNAPNNMTFTAGNNIMMTAGKDITSIAGNSMFATANVNIVSNAGVNMIDTAGRDLMQTATGNIHESSDMRSEISENERNIQAKKSDSYAEKVTVVSTKENMILQSEKTVKSQSGEQGNSH